MNRSIVDGDTLSRLDDRFDVRSHGEARLKGKARPVTVYSISGERDASIVRRLWRRRTLTADR